MSCSRPSSTTTWSAPRPDDSITNIRRAIAEAARVLEPGGRLVVAESCVPRWFYAIRTSGVQAAGRPGADAGCSAVTRPSSSCPSTCSRSCSLSALDRSRLPGADRPLDDAVRPPLADGADPGTRRHGRGPQTDVSSFNRLRARLETPAEDLAWLLVPAAALVLAAAFVWLAPSLSHLYPSPTGDLFPVWQITDSSGAARGVAFDPRPGRPVPACRRSCSPSARRARRDGRWIPLVDRDPGRGGPCWSWPCSASRRTRRSLSPDYFHRYLLSAPEPDRRSRSSGCSPLPASLRPPAGTHPDVSSRPALGGWRWLAVVIAVAVTAIWLLPASTPTTPSRGLARWPPVTSRSTARTTSRRSTVGRRWSTTSPSTPICCRSCSSRCSGRSVRRSPRSRSASCVALRPRDARDLRRLRPGHPPAPGRALAPVRALGRARPLPLARHRSLPGVQRHLLRRPAGPLLRALRARPALRDLAARAPATSPSTCSS